MKKSTLITTLLLLCVYYTSAQVSISNDGSAPNNAAMLDVKSTTRGLLPPRMTSEQMNGIVTPPSGLLIYNTSMNALYWYNGSSWKKFNEISYMETDPVFTLHPASSITSWNINNWNTAYSWGNHATAGYLTGYTETDPLFGEWNKCTGIVITSSQVSDFTASVTNNPAMLANTAKNSYPLADGTKLAGISAGAEVNVNADWNATSGDATILNKPVLATVATTGNYYDLVIKPVGTAVGDMLYWSGTQWTRVPVGNPGQALVLNGSVPAWGQTIINQPIVTTNPVTNISSNSALCGGNCSDGGTLIIQRGVCWSTSVDPTINDNKTSDGSGSGAFSSNLTSLSAYTTYHVRAYATNNTGTTYGNDTSFSTTIITTTAVTNIMAQSATSGGTISGDGGNAITAKGVCWNIITAPTIGNYKTSDGTGIATFTSNLTNLTGNTMYYVRAYYTNSLGTFYGNEVTFVSSSVIPVVTTGDTLNVTKTTAQIVNNNVTNDGGCTVINRGLCWGTAANPIISGSKTTDGSGLGLFTSSFAGLTQNTTYHVRAYATNCAGTGYGSDVSFVTKGTMPTVTTDDVQGITTTSSVAFGTITASGSSSVTERGFCWRVNIANPVITNSKLACGGGTGSFNGVLTFLAPNTTFHLRAYAINAQGTSYGADSTFNTLPAYYEGFESGMPNGWNGMWSLSTSNHYERYYSLYSDHIYDTISFTRTIATPAGGQISFWYLAVRYVCDYGSSHVEGGTSTQFFIDNVLQTTCSNTTWSVMTFPVTAGTHTFKWKNMGRPAQVR